MTSAPARPQASTEAASIVTTAWSPLKNGLFRGLWIATIVSNLGTWGRVDEIVALACGSATVTDGPHTESSGAAITRYRADVLRMWGRIVIGTT